jgi:peptidoglycan hydrolase-like protein with peptidoglycan-binding domain
VLKLQERLIELDYAICDLNETYDLQTQAAVGQFQAANGLPGDVIVNSWTWSVLFNPSTKPLSQEQATRYTFDEKYTLQEKAWAPALDENSLWYFSDGQVIQFDPEKMRPVTEISMPFLGQETAADGAIYDIQFGPSYIFPPLGGDQVWMIGGYGSGIGNPSDAALSITTSGELGIGPTLFPGAYGGVLDAVLAGNEMWTFHQRSSDVIFYIVDTTEGLIPQARLGQKFVDTNAYSWGGGQLFALIAREGHALAPVDAYAATYGPGIGVCGLDLAWDGEWLWVLQDNQLRAYDTKGQLQAIADPPKGYEIREFTAGNGAVAAIAGERSKRFIILFNK